MYLESLPLAKQLELVFGQLVGELRQLSSGTVFMQIRNNAIGKFGVRHFPLEFKGGVVKPSGSGLSDSQIRAFRDMAVGSLHHKVNWTHGEITFDFTVRQSTLCTSVQFESNYNMANLLPVGDKRKEPHRVT